MTNPMRNTLEGARWAVKKKLDALHVEVIGQHQELLRLREKVIDLEGDMQGIRQEEQAETTAFMREAGAILGVDNLRPYELLYALKTPAAKRRVKTYRRANEIPF